MLTLAQLLTKRSQDEITASLVQSLKGISPVLQVGPGLGSVRITGIGKIDSHIIIRIESSGQVGSATYSLSVNGGGTWSAPSAVPSALFQAGSTGAIVAFSNSSLSSESFVAGTTYDCLVTALALKTSAWQQFSTGGRFLKLEAEVAEDFDQRIASIAALGFLSTSQGEWLDLVAKEVYDEERREEISAQGIVRLTDDGGGPYIIAVGELIVSDPTGLFRFSNTEEINLDLNGTVNVRVVAESGGLKYNLPNGAVTSLVSSFPGLSVVNVSRVSAATKSPLGAAELVIGGEPTIDANLRIELEDSSHFKWSLDVGSTWEATGLSLSTTPVTLGTSGVTVASIAGETYVTGATYDCEIGVSWLSVAGDDKEGDDGLRLRCTSKWATLAFGQPDDVWYKWATEASENVNRTFVRASETTPGEIDIVVAGPLGSVSQATIDTIDAVLQPRAVMPSVVVLHNASTKSVALTGSVFVDSAHYASASTNISTALNVATSKSPIGGVVNGEFPIEILTSAIMSAPGVLDVDLDQTTDILVDWDEVVVADISGLILTKVN
jgi:hypothetical protein